jgi:TonB family protein
VEARFCATDVLWNEGVRNRGKWARIFAVHLLPKLALVALVGCAPAWAQSTSAREQPGNPANQQTQSPTPAPDSDKKAPADQTSAPSPGDSTKLEPIKTEKAIYPLEAADKRLQGQVWVKILVSETGDVENVEVISGDPVLAEAAVHAAKKWKFKPFIKNGKPVKASAKLPFDFAFASNVHEEKVPPVEGNTVAGTAPVAGEAPYPVRVSSGVIRGLLIHTVQPIYPPGARQAHIEGVVVLQAKITKEGRIADLRLISGPKELAEAAIGAVQQWRYRPYMLKGEPVEVETQMQVNFTLSH